MWGLLSKYSKLRYKHLSVAENQQMSRGLAEGATMRFAAIMRVHHFHFRSKFGQLENGHMQQINQEVCKKKILYMRYFYLVKSSTLLSPPATTENKTCYNFSN
jgi:hypothetical protein